MDMLTAAKPISQMTIYQLRTMASLPNPRDEVSRLERILVPATDEEKAAALAFLFKCLPMANGEDDESERILMQGYMLAISGYPKWAVLEARDAFIRGEVGSYTSSFAPNPADLGREVSRRVNDDHERLRRARKQAREQDEPDYNRIKLSDEAREAGRQRIAELRAHAAAERERLVKPIGHDFSAYSSRRDDENSQIDRPLTAEDVAHIPDAPKRTVGGPQKIQPPSAFDAFRRKA